MKSHSNGQGTGPVTRRKGPEPKLDDPQLQENFLKALLITKCVKKACKKAGVSPAVFFFYVGKPENHTFKATVDECRRAIGDTLFEEAVAIADDDSRDTIEEYKSWDKKGASRRIPNNAAVGRDRLRIDTRLRIAGKLRPKEYGDAPAVAVNVQNNSILCDEETRLRIQEMRKQLILGKSSVKDAHVIEETNDPTGQAPGAS